MVIHSILLMNMWYLYVFSSWCILTSKHHTIQTYIQRYWDQIFWRHRIMKKKSSSVSWVSHLRKWVLLTFTSLLPAFSHYSSFKAAPHVYHILCSLVPFDIHLFILQKLIYPVKLFSLSSAQSEFRYHCMALRGDAVPFRILLCSTWIYLLVASKSK